MAARKRDPWIRACRFETAHDGDTARFTVDCGFGLSLLVDVRLAGLNAPEVVGEQRAAGLEATAWVRDWLAVHSGHALTTRDFPLTLDTSSTEKYGRWLAIISCGRAHVLNDDLIAAGHAVPWDGSGPRP